MENLDNYYFISEEQIGQYDSNGHLLLSDVFTQNEMIEFRQAVMEVVEKHTKRTPLAERDEYGQTFLYCMNLWDKSEKVKKFILCERLARIAAALLHADRVRLMNDTIYFKETGSKATAWHIDKDFYPIDSAHFISLWIRCRI